MAPTYYCRIDVAERMSFYENHAFLTLLQREKRTAMGSIVSEGSKEADAKPQTRPGNQTHKDEIEITPHLLEYFRILIEFDEGDKAHAVKSN
jgi:hypothetical protein